MRRATELAAAAEEAEEKARREATARIRAREAEENDTQRRMDRARLRQDELRRRAGEDREKKQEAEVQPER